MAAVASITIEVNESGAVASIGNLRKSVSAVDPALQKVGQRGNVVMTQLAKDHQRAHDAASLLSRTVGVELPRSLEKVLASSKVIGPALSSAFNVAVLAGFSVAIVDLLQKIPEITDRIFDWTGSLKAQSEAQAKVNSQLVDGAQKVRELQNQYKLIGLIGSNAFAQSQENIRDEIKRTKDELESANKALQNLSKTQALPGRFEAYARIGSMIGGVATPLEQAQKGIPDVQNQILVLGARLTDLQNQLRNTGKEFGVAFSSENTEHIIAMREAAEGLTSSVVNIALGPVLDAAAQSANDAAKGIEAVNTRLDQTAAHQQEIAKRRIELSKDVQRAEEDAAIAILPPWQRANAEIVLDLERRRREIDEQFKGIQDSGVEKSRALAAAWQ